MKVSFCIPTLNRPGHALIAIKSICSDNDLKLNFEVCVFNNASDTSYEQVESVIEQLSANFNIIYKKGRSRLNIDQSMMEAIKLASGDWYFFLGDDDYLNEHGVANIIELIDNDKFDMAIFNATMVDPEKATKKELIGYNHQKFNDLNYIFVHLKKYCAYGNLLINRRHINFDDFNYLIGTSHAYGCFWVSFFKDFENDINPIVIIPEQPVVNLTYVQKNYRLLEITFKHADIEHQKYYQIIGPKSTKVLQQFESDLWAKQTSFKQLLRFELGGNDTTDIKIYNKNLYQKLWVKIGVVKALSPIVKIFKKPIKAMIRLAQGSNN